MLAEYTQPIVAFDGTCTFCNKAVAFILKNESAKTPKLLFTSLDSETGKQIKSPFNPSLDSIIFYEHGKTFAKSDAIIKLGEYLKFPFSLAKWLKILPKFLRDMGYDFVAGIRKKIMVNDQCLLFDNQSQSRFIL